MNDVAPGCEPHRIAEVIATLPDGTSRRASGYRVTSASILTARHAVDGARHVVTRFDAGGAGEWTASADVVWRDPEHDIAVLRLDRPEEDRLAPVRYGRLADRSAFIPVHAAGFPLWKRRDRPDGRPYRELHDAGGTLPVLSNRRGGTLEIHVPPPAEAPDPWVSPWKGMSGAALWAGDHIIGVVAEHHRSEGPGRLTATRVDRLIEAVDGEHRATLLGLLGLCSPELPDVLPPEATWPGRSGYLEQVRDIAPAHGLRDRERELAELAAFAAGDEACVWWQAGPWAGKTALMSTFVLNPPAGLDVVSSPWPAWRCTATHSPRATTSTCPNSVRRWSPPATRPARTPSPAAGPTSRSGSGEGVE
jgi:hypothetical protein